MKIEMHEAERSTIEEFAEKHDLIMEIYERTPSDLGKRWNNDLRFYAHFKHCEIKIGNMLQGAFGDGPTPEEAIGDYAKIISEQHLIIDACTPNRREIFAPILVFSGC